jgi:cytochrome c2
MKKNVLTVLLVALTLVLGLAVIVSANIGALDDFNAQYPSNTFNNSCKICHTSGADVNPYGTALADAGGRGVASPPQCSWLSSRSTRTGMALQISKR